MTDIRNFIKNTFLKFKDLTSVGTANIAAMGISSIFWLYMAALIGEEGYGNIGYLLATAGIVGSISMLGASDTLTVFRAKDVKLQSGIFLIVIILFPLSSINAEENDKRNKITKNLRCLICQGQSVYDSDSEFANSLKIVVDKKLQEGLSEDQIYEYFKTKYGEWILYDPGLNKNTYILWLLPILIFLIGGAIIYKSFIVKK